MYSVVIIDDEQLAIDVLMNYIGRFDDFKIAATFTDPVEAFSYLNSTDVDLVFSDIAMPNMSGTELVKSLNQKCKFVMVTSYSDYAIESFELDVIDYLLKPVAFNRFTQTLDKFKERITTHSADIKKSFFIKEGDEYVKIYIEDIDYIEGMKDYAKIQCNNNHYIALKTLKSIEELLGKFNFARVHKSYIVPLEKISQYNGRCILIQNNEIPVGSKYRERIKEYLNSNKF